LGNNGHRVSAIQSLLARSLPHIGTFSVADREFLEQKLRIPSAWTEFAMGLRAETARRYLPAVEHYLRARRPELAHKLLLEHLAPELIIKENYQLLSELLRGVEEQLEDRDEWVVGGKLYRDYVEVTLDFPIVLQQVAKEVSSGSNSNAQHRLLVLKGLMLSLTRGLTKMKQHDSLQFRVAFEEIAAKTSLRLQLIQESTQQAEEHEFLVTKLPLTEDQRLIRIHNLSENFFNSILSS